MPPIFQRITRSRRLCWLVACGVLGGVMGPAWSAKAQPDVYGNPDSSAFIRIPKNADDWTRHFRIGAVVGLNIGANFSVRGGAISGNNPAAGIYDDGYARDDSSGNAIGYTSYWGYQKASQYNAAAQTLTMHSTSSYSVTSGGRGSADDGPFAGFDMAYGGNLWYWKHARVGWELGFDLLPISITDSQPMNGTVNQTTYTFNVGANNPDNASFPGAGYSGGYNRHNGDWTIPRNPYNTSSTPIQNQTITGSRTLDVTLYAIRLGPSFYWDLTHSVGMSLGAGPALGIASGDCSYNEVITISSPSGTTTSRNHGSFGATDVVYGGYVNGTVMYHVEDNGQTADIYLGVQYMPLQDAHFNGPGLSSTLNLGGQVYITAGINWPF